MDDEFAAIERQLASDPGNTSLIHQLARLYKRSGRLHKGRTLEQWVDLRLYQFIPVREQNHATKMLLQIGPAAIPDILQALSSEKSDVRRYAANLIGKFRDQAALAVPKLIELLSDDNPDLARASLKSLGLIGASASVAIPKILEHFGKSAEGIQSLFAIDPEHPAALEYMERALNQGHYNNRIYSAATLLKLGEAGHVILHRYLSGGNEVAILAILTALRRFHVPSAFLPGIARHLDSRGVENIGYSAGRALVAAGKTALPHLVKCVQEGSPTARRHALQALRDLGTVSLPAMSLIVNCLSDPDRRIRGSALQALGSLGEAAQENTAKIIEVLKNEESVNRKSALVALSKIATREESRPIIQEYLEDPAPAVAQSAQTILEALSKAKPSP